MALPYWQNRTYGDYLSKHHRAYLEALDLALGGVLVEAACRRAIASIVIAAQAFLDVQFACMGAQSAFEDFYDAMLTDYDRELENSGNEETLN